MHRKCKKCENRVPDTWHSSWDGTTHIIDMRKKENYLCKDCYAKEVKSK